ncbi:beta-lactamase-like protein [Peziza echinospora]|nr:beta-lactamase-like protein [Peziza echinospora]
MNTFARRLSARPAASASKLAIASPSSVNATLKSHIPRRNMQIKSIPMWTGTGDNYAYILIDDKTKDAVIIDPAHPPEVLPVLKEHVAQKSINFTAVLNTHHHRDHSGGNDALLKAFPSVPILGGEQVPSLTRRLKDREVFKVGEDIKVTALHTPCHTQDSICYFAEDSKSGEKAVFTGDTLFIGGCGRFFEGTPAEMHKALNETLAALPDNTSIYPGHEYTKSNVKFGLSILPKADPLLKLADFCKAQTETQGKFTIGDEKKHNVFMRVNDPEVQKATGKTDPVDVMGELRKLKNSF